MNPDGPIVQLVVGVSMPRMVALQAAQLPTPQPRQIFGLIDTGASCTAIDSPIIRSLGINPTGTTQILTPSTGGVPHQCDQYDVGIAIVMQQLHFMRVTLAVIESDLSNQPIDALIGRDLLSQCMMIYNGPDGYISLAI